MKFDLVPDKFHIARSRALEAYADVEHMLCRLFSSLMKCQTLQDAVVVFFRITSTHARNAIIEALLERRHGTTYSNYWHGIPNSHPRRGLLTLIRHLDNTRNKIVHWTAGGADSLTGPTKYYNVNPEAPTLEISDLHEFTMKAWFVGLSVQAFTRISSGGSFSNWQAWPEIFQQPAPYPPLSTHPLFQLHEEWKIQLRSSLE